MLLPRKVTAALSATLQCEPNHGLFCKLAKLSRKFDPSFLEKYANTQPPEAVITEQALAMGDIGRAPSTSIDDEQRSQTPSTPQHRTLAPIPDDAP